jgi:hypothetical protein
MSLRLATAILVVAAFVADAAGEHSLAYYALVASVPAAALAALLALGAILDGSAAEPADRVSTSLAAVLLPCLLLATAVRAPLVVDGPPPSVGVAAMLGCLAVLALQGLVAAAVAVERLRLAQLGDAIRER